MAQLPWRGLTDRLESVCSRATPVSPGDRAQWRADGNIEFRRRDAQIKLRGFRVEPGEIEAEISRHPEVRASAVKLVVKSAEEKTLAAYFVPRNGHPPEPEALRDFLRRRLPDYMVPAAFVRLEQLPLTTNGKLDRRALPDPERPGVVRPGSARNPIEYRVGELMAAALGLPKVSIEDDFFRLGGHSLLAMDLLARLRKAFGVRCRRSNCLKRQQWRV